MLALALRNYGNTCYQNAFALSWVWACAANHAVQEWRQNNGYRLGNGEPILSALLTKRPRGLSSIFAWSQVLHQWRRPQDQHDVGEFATHVLSRLKPAYMTGQWVARVMDQEC